MKKTESREIAEISDIDSKMELNLKKIPLQGFVFRRSVLDRRRHRRNQTLRRVIRWRTVQAAGTTGMTKHIFKVCVINKLPTSSVTLLFNKLSSLFGCKTSP